MVGAVVDGGVAGADSVASGVDTSGGASVVDVVDGGLASGTVRPSLSGTPVASDIPGWTRP